MGQVIVNPGVGVRDVKSPCGIRMASFAEESYELREV